MSYCKLEASFENDSFWYKADGCFQNETISYSILMETYNSDGESHETRRYGFRGSTFYGQTFKKINELFVYGCSNHFLKFEDKQNCFLGENFSFCSHVSGESFEADFTFKGCFKNSELSNFEFT